MSPLLFGGLFLGSVAALTAAGGILMRHGRSSLHRWIAALLFFAVAWCVVVNLQDAARGDAYNLTIIQLTFMAAVMMLYSMVRFALEATGLVMRHLVLALSVASAIVVAATAAGLVVSDVVTTTGTVVPVREPLYGVVTALLLGQAAIALAVLAVGCRRAQYAAQRRQLAVVTIGLTLGTVAGALTNIILPNTVQSLAPARFAWIALALWTVVLVYAVARHRFLDIRAVAVRTIAYLLVIATLVAVYSVVLMVVFLLLSSSGRSPELLMVINAAIAVLMALIFQPLKRFFDMVTNSVFYRGSYSRSEFFARLSATLVESNSLTMVLRRSANLIATTLSASQAFFVVYHRDKVLSSGTAHHARMAGGDLDWLARAWPRLSPDGPLLALGEVEGLGDEYSEALRVLRSYDVAVVVALRKNKDILGFFCVGERKNGHYTSRDLATLEAVADELAIAVQNAQSLEEIHLLNETLQLRVSEATKELRRSNAQLRRLDEAKDEFISMASHQLRTPLTSIKGYVDMILQGDAGAITPTQRKFLTEAFVSSERMVHLINDFLNMSRLQTGRFVIEQRPTDLAKVVRQEIDSLLLSAEGRGLKFEVSTPDDLAPLMLDEAKIRQVIMNFADNALYYSPEGGVVRVRLAVEDGDVALTVRDSGIGVPPSEQAQLFTKFYRASNARRQRPDGTGVGLFLAKKVVVEHGGSIIFASEEGKGSTFGFRLPMRRLAVEARADDSTPS